MNTSQANVSKPARAVVAEQPSLGIQMGMLFGTIDIFNSKH